MRVWSHHEVRVTDDVVSTVTVVCRKQILVEGWRLGQ